MLTAGLAAALCAALTMPALTSTHADQPATTNVEGLAARFTDDDLFMVNSAADSSRRMYAVSRNGDVAYAARRLAAVHPRRQLHAQRAECAGRQTEQRKWHGGRARRGTSERRAGDGMQRLGRQMRPFAFLSIPSAAVGDISASDGVVVQRDGSAITIAATAEPVLRLTSTCMPTPNVSR